MYAVAFILVPRERVSGGNLVRRILGSVKPYSLLAGGQQINVLRRRAPKRPHLNNTDRFLFVWLYH